MYVAERTIEYEQDEESEEEPEAMETEQPTEVAQVETQDNQVTETNHSEVNQQVISSEITETTIPNSNKSEQNIPGGPSSLLANKAILSVQQEDMDGDESRSQTPKLDDISDEEIDPTLENEDDDDTVDNMNDPSKHPALAPHAQAHLSDDESMTDSTTATPQTEGNTPMPLLEDDDMEEPATQAHPLSQEILTTTNEPSLNNDSPAVQTPEDIHD